VALFGRKINNAEHQLAFIEMLRLITDEKLNPEEAVRAYHGVLQGKGIKPHRLLEDDLRLTDQAMSYDGGSARRSSVEIRNYRLAAGNHRSASAAATQDQAQRESSQAMTSAAWPKLSDGTPDFVSMNSEQRRAYDAWRLTRKFG
jgi:hypothetical protein